MWAVVVSGTRQPLALTEPLGYEVDVSEVDGVVLVVGLVGVVSVVDVVVSDVEVVGVVDDVVGVVLDEVLVVGELVVVVTHEFTSKSFVNVHSVCAPALIS
jgi:hypothetical protein